MLVSTTTNPFFNLATEEWLFRSGDITGRACRAPCLAAALRVRSALGGRDWRAVGRQVTRSFSGATSPRWLSAAARTRGRSATCRCARSSAAAPARGRPLASAHVLTPARRATRTGDGGQGRPSGAPLQWRGRRSPDPPACDGSGVSWEGWRASWPAARAGAAGECTRMLVVCGGGGGGVVADQVASSPMMGPPMCVACDLQSTRISATQTSPFCPRPATSTRCATGGHRMPQLVGHNLSCHNLSACPQPRLCVRCQCARLRCGCGGGQWNHHRRAGQVGPNSAYLGAQRHRARAGGQGPQDLGVLLCAFAFVCACEKGGRPTCGEQVGEFEVNSRHIK